MGSRYGIMAYTQMKVRVTGGWVVRLTVSPKLRNLFPAQQWNDGSNVRALVHHSE